MSFKLIIAQTALLGASIGFCLSAGTSYAEGLEQGFVFIDGEYLPGPYTVVDAPGGATINGRGIALFATPNAPRGASPMQTNGRGWRGAQFVIEGSATESRPPGESRRPPGENRPSGDRRPPQDERRNPFGDRRPGERGFPGQNRPGFPAPPNDARRVTACLERDGIVVSFSGKIAVLIEQHQALELLRVLAGGDDVSAALRPFLTDRTEAERDQWKTWLADYTAPAPLLSRVNLIIENHEQLVSENLADVAATRRLRSFAYPLTVLGMVLGVFALGHLLSSPPKGAPREPNSPRNFRFRKAAWISLGLVVLLSGLDLAWTLLASQAGQMNELNPLGSRMIEDPLLLTLFKSSATFGSCGLLLVLSKHQRAQWAAWWMCLVLTVLTFRWLVLNSMFVV